MILGIRFLFSLGLGVVLIPLLVEIAFIPKYIWPNSLGSFYELFLWTKFPLGILFAFFWFYLSFITNFASQQYISKTQLELLKFSLQSYFRAVLGAAGYGFVTWAGSGLGARMLMVFGISPILINQILNLGLSLSVSLSFVALLVFMVIGELRLTLFMMAEARKRQTELSKA